MLAFGLPCTGLRSGCWSAACDSPGSTPWSSWQGRSKSRPKSCLRGLSGRRGHPFAARSEPTRRSRADGHEDGADPHSRHLQTGEPIRRRLAPSGEAAQELPSDYEEAREAKGRRQAGDSRPASREPFEDFARDWLENFGGRTERGISASGLADYRRSIEQLAIPFFGRQRLAEIEPADVRRFARHLEDRGHAPGTVRKYLQAVRALFAEAVDDGALAVDPSARVRVRARRQDADGEEPAKAMTREELERLLAATPPRWLPFFSLLAETGLRISEILGLDWSDFNLGERPSLRVRRQFYRGEIRKTKTATGRRVLPISAEAASWVRANLPSPPEGAVFATRTGRTTLRSQRQAHPRQGH